MNRRQLAGNLAISLTLGAWSKPALCAALQRRLPRALHRLSYDISAMLIQEAPTSYAPAPKWIEGALKYDDQFERIFRFCRKHDIWPDPDLTSPVMAPIDVFSMLKLPQLPTLAALADWLLLPPDRLTYLADLTNRFEDHDDMAVNHYHTHLKPKKSGGLRVIEAPKQQLKTVQRQILTAILDPIPTHPNAYGFVRGRDCLAGANCHVGEHMVVCFDLKDFFPSIQRARVFGLFRSLGYPLSVATHLAALCTTVSPQRVIRRLPILDRTTYRTPHLPQGAPTSPALANHAAFTLDKRLSGLAKRIDAKYSRYADDLTFSGDAHIARILQQAVPSIIQDEGFSLNPQKSRLNTAGQRQIVTGVVVNSHLNIKRDSFDQLKAVIHACGKPEDKRLADPVFLATLEGKLDWVERVNPNRGQKLKKLLASAMDKPDV